MSAVKGKFGNGGACYKAPDLVKILKVRRRWEGAEGGRIVEAERTAGRCKGPRQEEALRGGETEAGPHTWRSESKHPPQGPHEYSGKTNVRVLSAPQSNIPECEEACRVYNPASLDRMHGTDSGGLGRYFGPVCVLIAV